jgi:type II secretion system protein L
MAMPCAENAWCILLNADNAIINCANSESHSCDIDNLPAILDALLEQAETAPESISYYHKAGDTQAAAIFDNLQIPCTAGTYQNHPLEIFAGSINRPHSINILQGEFAAKRESNSGWLQAWKLAASIAGIWIVLYLAYTSMLSSQLEAQNISLAKNIEAEFRRAIPDAKQMTNMQKRVEQQLKDLKSAGSASQNNGFLQILSATAATLSETRKIHINATVYRNNYIDIDLSATSLQDIEQLKNKLLDIKKIKTTLSTTVEKDKVKGRLRLEAKG